jgi:hypothetical protein
MRTGICAVIKDCREIYLREWVEWHTALGFDNFIIYDNGSVKPIRETLSEYKNVLVYNWSERYAQKAIYRDCLQKQKSGCLPTCDWLAFIDDDEFIMVENKEKSIKDIIGGCYGSALALNWLVFGGVNEKNDILQVDKMLYRISADRQPNHHVKSIVQPIRVRDYHTPHNFYMQGDTVDVYNESVRGPFTKHPTDKVAWINHYWGRSPEEYRDKCAKGRVDIPSPQRGFQEYLDIQSLATVFDDRAKKRKYEKNT